MSTARGRTKQQYKAEMPINTSLEKKQGFVQVLFLVLLSAILFFPPFLRGLFFEKEQFVVEAFTFAVFILFWLYKFIIKDKNFLQTPIELAALGLLLLYLISIIYAVSTRDAISEWLKYCMYFSIFFMLTDVLSTFKLRRTFLWVVSGVAVLLCLVGIDGAAGATVTNGINQVLKSMGAQNDLFFGVFVGGRIFSSLQYPNALASYVMATFIITVGLGTTYTNRWAKSISGAMASLFFLTFILTFSRGAYILFPVAVIILLIVLPKVGRIRTLSYGLIPILAAVPFSLLISRFMGEQTLEGKKVWTLTFGCMAVAGIATYAYSYISGWLEKISWKVYLSVFTGLIILGGIGAAIAFNSASPLILEHSASETDSDLFLQKSITLIPCKEYTLQLEVDASSSVDKPYTYQISIDSKNMKDILSSGQTQLAILSDKNTSGSIVKNVNFVVPEDSRAVNIIFRNYYQGTEVTLNNAVIIDKNTNNIVKKLKLNYKYIPKSIAQRFENLGADQSNIQRQVYFKDAGKMIRDRWFLGGGGKAWEKLYYSYQSFGYSSTQAHNYFLQVAIEIGIVGILVLLLLISSIIYVYFKRQDKAKLEERVLQASLLTAIISMLVHSAIDFDFSLSAVFLMLWQLLAVYNSSYRHFKEQEKNSRASIADTKVLTRLTAGSYKIRLQPILAIIILAVIIYFPITLRSALSHAGNYDKYARENNVDMAVAEIKKAVKLDPLNSQYSIKYLSHLLTKKNITKVEMEQVAGLTERVEKSSTYDANLATNYAGRLLSTGNINKGMEYLDLGIKLRPHYLVQWKTKVNACYQIAGMQLSAGATEKALEYANKGLEVIEEARETNKLSLVPFAADEVIMGDLEKLRYIKDIYTNNTEYDKKVDVNTILFYNISSMDINSDNILDQWTTDTASQLMLISGQKGMTVSGQKGVIQSRPLNFEAGKKYQIEVKLQDANSIDKIPYIITGVMGANELLEYKDGLYTATVKLGDQPVTGAVKLELPEGCVVEEVLVRIVS